MMQRSVTLVAASAALSWVGAGAVPHGSAFRRRAVAQIPGYDFTGCYTEATSMRALTGSSYVDDLMTVEKCANACAGFKYFGIEYGRECYCGNTINDGSVEAELADCSFACPGDSTESCGAGDRLNLYTRTTDPDVPTLGAYSSRGCYVEPSNARALTSQMTRADDMTVEKCATFCGDAGYTLFGLEYYNECYCGNILTPGAVSADATDCSYPCAGNSDELCGGDWRLNLYEFSLDSPSVSTSTTTSSSPVSTATAAAYTSEGCYTEATGIRALSDLAYYDDAMTVEKCAAACAGYTWFGVEYGRECYGGNTIHSAEGSVPADLSECNYPCAGNPSERCGAGNRLNIYRYLASATSSSTSSDISVDTSTISIATSTTDPAVSATSTTSEPVSSTAASDSSTLSSTTVADEATTSTTTVVDQATISTTTVVDEATTSTTTSSSAAATTSAAATNAINNGDFEGTGGWTIKSNAGAYLTYNFVNTNSPYGGLNSASITYNTGAAAYQAWYNQVITLKPNTRYTFSGWTKASIANPGCNVYYYIGDVTGATVLKIMVPINSAQLKTTWVESTGFYDTISVTQYTFNVRMTCTGTTTTPRTYYMDNLSLIETSS